LAKVSVKRMKKERILVLQKKEVRKERRKPEKK